MRLVRLASVGLQRRALFQEKRDGDGPVNDRGVNRLLRAPDGHSGAPSCCRCLGTRANARPPLSIRVCGGGGRQPLESTDLNGVSMRSRVKFHR